MTRHVDEVRNKLSYLHSNINILDLLMEFERTLDNTNIYAYENWMEGEIIDGPMIDRYWVTVVFMYPAKMRPDPLGAKRLEKYGCKVVMEKDTFKAPTKIRGRSSYSDFTNRVAKVKTHNIWTVAITMPKRFLDERILDTIEHYADENSLVVDTEDISAAYDDSLDSVEDFEMDTDMGGDESDMGEEL